MDNTVAMGMRQAIAVLQKDLRAEIRNRSALNAIALFSITTLVVVAFALGPGELPLVFKAALLWVVLFFSAFSGLAHVFLHEEDSGTSTALRLCAAPGAVYAGKLAFNLLLLLGIAMVVVPLFAALLHLRIELPFGFLAALVSGSVGLGASATIVAAIIAKARGRGALYGALGFPILLPLLFLAVDATRLTLSGEPASGLQRDIVGLAAFATMLITASALVFPYIWEE